MADSIAKVLADIAESLSKGGDLNKLLSDIEKNQKSAFDTGNMKKYEAQLESLKKMIAATQKAQEDYNKAEEEANKITDRSSQAYKDQMAKLERLGKVVEKTEGNIKKVLQERSKLLDEAKKKQDEYNKIVSDHWKQNTRLGSMYAATTGSLAKMAAGFTAGSVALKALNKYLEAARLKQELMIRAFRDMEDTETYGQTAERIYDTDVALRKASANAILFGQDVNQVSNYMLQFQKITGTDNPQALEKMTSATMAAARVTGVDMGTAMAHVKDRIDKFGGSAASAITSMMELRDSAKDINNAFNQTVIRADDVINSVNQITSANNIYAVDQDFVTKTITRNMLTLQSQGESYDFAREKAMDYMKAVTTEAPEFMKIKSGQALKDEMSKALAADQTGEAFMAQFGDALERAKPGLAEKVKKIATDPNMAPFSKTMLIQEMTSGTEFGMDKMNDMILKFGKQSGGVEIIRQMYNTTRAGALAIIEQAQERKQMTDDIKSLETATYKEAVKKLGIENSSFKISEANFLELQKTKEGRQQLYESAKSQLMIEGQIAEKNKDMQQAYDLITKQAKQLKELEEARAAAGDDAGAVAVFDKQIEDMQNRMADTATRLSKKQLEDFEGKFGSQIGNLDAITEKATNMLSKTNEMTGTSIKALLTEYSGILQTAATAGALFLFKNSFEKMLNRFLDRFQTILMKTSGIDNGRGGDWGDGGGGGGGGGLGRGKKTVLGKLGQRTRIGARKLSRKFGRLGKIGSTLAGALPLAGELLGDGGRLFEAGSGLFKGAAKGVAKGAAKGGLKAARSLPILGSLVSAGFAAENLWDIGKGFVSGKGVKTSDVAKLGSNIAGFFDPTGLVAAADTLAEMSGAYDKLDTLTGPSLVKGTNAAGQLMPISAATATADGGGSNKLTSSRLFSQGGSVMIELPSDQLGVLAAAISGAMNKAAKA